MRRWIVATLAVLLLIAAAALWLWPGAGGQSRAVAAPIPPVADLTRVDPAVKSMIDEVRARVVSDPANADSWLALGMAYAANEFPEQAILALREFVQMRTDQPRGWYHLAIIHADQGQTDEAMSSLNRAAALTVQRDRYAPIHWRLGRLLLQAGSVAEAEKEFRLATEIDQLDSAGWIGLALVDLERGADAEAAVKLEKLLAWTTTNVEYAQHLLASTYRRLGRPDEAARLPVSGGMDAKPVWNDLWANDLVPYRPGPGAKVAMARELMASGRVSEAVAMLESMRQQWPDRASVLMALGSAYRQARRIDDSIAVLKDAVARNPDAANVRFDLATSLAKKTLMVPPAEAGPWREAALAEVNKALELDQRHALSHALKADLLVTAARYEAAIASYQQAAQFDASTAKWSYGAGVVQLQLSRWSDAADSFAAALARAPDDVDALLGLAMARIKLGRLDEAQTSLDRAKVIAPKNTKVDAAIEELTRARQAAAQPVG